MRRLENFPLLPLIDKFLRNSFLLATVALAACAAGIAHGQIYSQPIGFLQQKVAAAKVDLTPGTTVVSFPLREAPVFRGNVTSVDGADTLTINAAGWTAGQFTATPFLARVVSGANVGRWFLITANTDSQLTVDPRSLDLTGLLSVGDGVEILPAHTLGSLFGTTNVALQSGDHAGAADTVGIWNGSKFKSYYFNGANWTKGKTGDNANAVVIPPDTGVMITRRSTEPLTLVFGGMVPNDVERSEVDGPASTVLANRFPVETTLAALGLNGLTKWRGRTAAAKADQIMVWKKGAWMSYYFDGSNWRSVDAPDTVSDTKKIKAGSAVLVVRQSEASGVDATLVQSAPY